MLFIYKLCPDALQRGCQASRMTTALSHQNRKPNEIQWILWLVYAGMHVKPNWACQFWQIPIWWFRAVDVCDERKFVFLQTEITILKVHATFWWDQSMQGTQNIHTSHCTITVLPLFCSFPGPSFPNRIWVWGKAGEKGVVCNYTGGSFWKSTVILSLCSILWVKNP